MLKSFLAASAMFLFSTSVFAMDIAPPTTDLSKATSGKYVMDPTHTSITFQVKHLGLSNYTGRFNTVSGDLTFDAKDPTKSILNVKIDPLSVDVNLEKLSKEIATKEDALSGVKFPEITFVSKSITKTSDTTGKITGDLTLLGVTKPVTLDAVFNGSAFNPFSKKPTLGFSATGSLKRSEFGATVWDKAVGDEVKLIIESEFGGE